MYSDSMMSVPLLLIAGVFFISFLLTMVGLGGGLVFSPLFVILGMSKAQAASASLFLNLTAAGSAASTYARKGMVDFSLSIPLIVSSAVAAPFGAYLNAQIDTTSFMLAMAAVLALAGIRMLVVSNDKRAPADTLKWKKILGGAGIGAGIGVLAGLLGVGGGVFVVPLLIFLLKTPTKTAAASSTFIVCFSSLTGFMGYVAQGGINWGFVLPAAAVSLLGGMAGARIMSTRMKGKNIRVLFSFVLFALCVRLLYQVFQGAAG